MKKTDSAVLLVDVQNDFCAGGSLAVPDGDAVVPVCNELIEWASARGWLVLASRDWHPVGHSSFAGFGGAWPAHCVAGTRGAGFHPDLRLPAGAVILDKAVSPDADAYSAFDGTGAAGVLRGAGVSRLFICGLATDYCVRATVLDALRGGFSAVVVSDGCRAVNLRPLDGEKAFAEMEAAGAAVLTLPQAKAAP